METKQRGVCPRFWRFALDAVAEMGSLRRVLGWRLVLDVIAICLAVVVIVHLRSTSSEVEEATRSVVRAIETEERDMELSWDWKDSNNKVHRVRAHMPWDPSKTADENKAAFEALVTAMKELYPPNV